MQVQVQLLAGLADGAQFGGLIDGTDLGGLGQADHAGLGVMNVLAFLRDLADRRGRQLTLLGSCHQQLGTVGEELRSAAFVGLDMRDIGADDAVIALAQGR